MASGHGGPLFESGLERNIDGMMDAGEVLGRVAGDRLPAMRPPPRTANDDLSVTLRPLFERLKAVQNAPPHLRNSVLRLVQEAVAQTKHREREGPSWMIWRDATHPNEE